MAESNICKPVLQENLFIIAFLYLLVELIYYL